MSGIFGLWNLDGRPLDGAVLKRMSATLAHRGPDGEGFWIDGPVGFGCQRFRVTPESLRECQPFVHSSGVVLVFDGRLDNREELLPLLKNFPGITVDAPDAAFIVAAYQAFGNQFAERLNGEFALGLFDVTERQLILVRDTIGIRPLHYWQNEKTFVFASEVKAILAHPQVSTRPDADTLASILLGDRSQVKKGFTCFEGVLSVRPAHVATVTPQRFRTHRYWDFDPKSQTRLGTFPEYAEAFRDCFEQAVRRRLRSAYPVAVTVSGGLDSSSVFCAAETLRRGAPDRYPSLIGVSQIFPEETPADERSFLPPIERDYGVQIQRVPMDSPSFVYGCAEQVWHGEVPYVDPQWSSSSSLYRAAERMGSRVLLTGLWGDQVLVDHAYFFDLYRTFRWTEILSHSREFRRWYHDLDSMYFQRFFFRNLSRRSVPARLVPLLRKLRTRLRETLSNRQSRSWYTDQFRRTIDVSSATDETLARGNFATVHAKSLYGTATSGYPVLVSEWASKIGAQYGLEISSPFLDRDLVSFLMSIPGDMQSWNGIHKAILRRAMTGILPREIVQRRSKADFTDRVNDGAVHGFPELIHHLELTGLAVKCGFLKEDVTNRLAAWRDKINSADCLVSWSLSDILALELWLQSCSPARPNNNMEECEHAETTCQ
jgi:asparagine synthase (glutamine-hydrolysing)